MSFGSLCAALGFGKVGCVWPFGDTILSAEASQERECLRDAFVQHLALGRKSCPQRVRKSVNDLLVPVCSIWLWAGAVQDIQHDLHRHLGARRNDIAAGAVRDMQHDSDPERLFGFSHLLTCKASVFQILWVSDDSDGPLPVHKAAVAGLHMNVVQLRIEVHAFVACITAGSAFKLR